MSFPTRRFFRAGQGERPLADALSAYLKDQGWGAVGRLAAVHRCWEEVAGVEVAAHVSPLSLREDTLVVAVDDPTWAAQMPFVAPTLLERLHQSLGADAPTRLEPRLRRPGARPSPGSSPL